MYNLIGLAGLARSGKDTVADYLQRFFNYKRMSFAQPIKDYMYVLNPYLEDGRRLADVVDSIGVEAAKNIPEVRRLYQVFGTEVGRDIDNSLWLKLAERNLNSKRKSVFSDVRYSNEAEFIHSKGGIVINITRPNMPRINEHASESGLCSECYDIDLINDGNLAQLYYKVDSILGKI